MKPRPSRFLFVTLLLTMTPAVLHAQTNYTVETKIDGVVGVSSRPNATSIQSRLDSLGFQTFYAVYPAIELKSQGLHTQFGIGYALGVNRTVSDLDFDYESHHISGSFSRSLGSRWRLNAADSFEMTPDFMADMAFQGILLDTDGFKFIFHPVASRRSSLMNVGSIDFNYDVTPTSTLSFGGSHAFRNYQDNLAFRGRLSDQSRTSSFVAFDQGLDERLTLSLGYGVAQMNFKDFGDARTHAPYLGFTYQFNPAWSIDVQGGPTFVDGLEASESYRSYNASASLRRTAPLNTLNLYYSRISGDISGLGSVSNIQHGGVSFSYQITPTISGMVDGSVFDTHGTLRNRFGVAGASMAASAGIQVSRSVSINFGGQYQKYNRASTFGFEDTRVFASLTFRPQPWRFSR